MNAKEQAKELYQSFFSLIVDAVDERELDAQELAKACAIKAIDFVLSIDSSVSYWHDVKEELNDYSYIPEEVDKERVAKWAEACHVSMMEQKKFNDKQKFFNDSMDSLYKKIREQQFKNGE